MPPTDTIPPARKAALDVLALVLDQAQDIQAAVDLILRRQNLFARDARLCTELAYGFVRHKTRLEHMVRFYLRKPGHEFSNSIFRVLCLAAYELHFLDRVPAYATVNWAVEMVKRMAGDGLSRMANAVLRSLDRERGRWVRPANILDAPLKAWAVYYSLPAWILDLLAEQFDRPELLHICEAQAKPPALGLRFNWSKDEARALYEALAVEQAPLVQLPSGLAYELTKAPDIYDDLAEGLVSRQSIAGQSILWELNFADWPEPIYDAAAGRGGKTCFLAEQGKTVWAGDTSFPRLRGLKDDLERLGLPPLPRVLADVRDTAPFSQTPRTFFLDAPCSGLGVLSRRPDIKWHLEAEDVRRLGEIQTQMLESAARQLPAGGQMVYMTCTLNAVENDGRVQELLGLRPELRLDAQVRTPLDHPGGEFFFAARLSNTR